MADIFFPDEPVCREPEQKYTLPKYTDLWLVSGRARPVAVLGNCVDRDGTIWCADYGTGERVDIAPGDFLRLADDQPGRDAVVKTLTEWAHLGNADAAWWLGWWWEGTNHPRSVWYYIAALRMDPNTHGWAEDRILDDAWSGYVCEGIPKPDLSFLREIQEFRLDDEGERGDIGDWKEAVRKAKAAVHKSARPQPETPDRVLIRPR
ncbi:hypothetical protein HF282_17725 [Acidithiobacillus ferrooxidans]|nr:hypothetical protein [Acidithiobacillus ferrooxidans]